MRWDNLATRPQDAALFDAATITTRTFDTPEFRGITFHEIHARTILNRIPDAAASRMPFRWTLAPYRGCSHACVYCFARTSHSYLDLDPGADFDSQIIVKTNAAELLRRQLASRTWRGEHIAMSTTVDCYQRAEGRYRLMPGIIAALRDHANPFSLLTKSTLILRDLPLLQQAAAVTDVQIALSVGSTDRELCRTLEPGTPAPHSRLQAVRRLAEHGISCSVVMAPVIPYLGDHPEQLRATVRDIAACGADSVTPVVLNLRPGAREWFMSWLTRHHPHLVPRYEQLYGDKAYAPTHYQEHITLQVTKLAQEHGLNTAPPQNSRSDASSPTDPVLTQDTLF
ncbi:Rv2578c family radical SAM protein [Streptomyces sp. NPDC012888]|uniref:Rv2578c family radical SAM protein n=1 Tax=Streptomyces sp. NPDC012888 TaxID=3364855 RepID=UPI0036AB3A9B